ncbi:MAG: FeoB-associated Cys-rich membrane protein [Clostridia bacterium]|nr:FeoB-associated Cys-rich membrane protein [Clostridia bacterium]MBR6650571.1 FeoB-associated Cys-rich membrane protein [Clostridia bacterium]
MNAPTIIIASVIAIIFIAIIVNEIIKKKQGKSSCSCGCNGCAFSESCHKK